MHALPEFGWHSRIACATSWAPGSTFRPRLDSREKKSALHSRRVRRSRAARPIPTRTSAARIPARAPAVREPAPTVANEPPHAAGQSCRTVTESTRRATRTTRRVAPTPARAPPTTTATRTDRTTTPMTTGAPVRPAPEHYAEPTLVSTFRSPRVLLVNLDAHRCALGLAPQHRLQPWQWRYADVHAAVWQVRGVPAGTGCERLSTRAGPRMGTSLRQ